MDIPHYIILFDTNILRGNPISHELTRFTSEYSDSKQVKISFLVPEIVREEFKNYFLESVEKALRNYNGSLETLDKFLGSRLIKSKNKKITTSTKRVSNLAEICLKDLNIQTLPTSYKKIKWKDLVRKAIQHESPFQDNEKGFKDAVIAESIFQNFQKLSKNAKVVFVCGDDRLRGYVTVKTSSINNFSLYKSIPDFETDLKLHLKKIKDELIAKIIQEAAIIFYNPQDPQSLYYSHNVESQIYQKYQSLFKEPQIRDYTEGLIYPFESEKWIPKNGGGFEVSNPALVDVNENGSYSWKSTILFRQGFEKQHPEPTSLAVLLLESVIVDYILEFEVLWQSEVTPDGKVTNSAIKEIKHTSVRTERHPTVISFPPIARSSGATLSGQGTVPVTTNVIPEPQQSRIPGVPTTTIVDPLGSLFDPDKLKED